MWVYKSERVCMWKIYVVAKIKKYLPSITDDSVTRCNKITEITKTVPTKSNLTNFYILLTFLLTTIVVSIYSYLIKYKARQKHLLLHYITNDKLKVLY